MWCSVPAVQILSLFSSGGINAHCLQGFGDLQYVVSTKIEEEFVRAVVSQTKTSDMIKDRLVLELLAPRLLLSGRDWFRQIMERRQAIGIPLVSWQALPVYLKGHWQNKPASLRDFNPLLKQLLESLACTVTSSHGLKATLLAFASSAGLEPHSRAALGYHKIAGESAAVRAYSRDRLCAPVKLLSEHLDRTRQSFHPQGLLLRGLEAEKCPAASFDTQTLDTAAEAQGEEEEDDNTSQSSSEPELLEVIDGDVCIEDPDEQDQVLNRLDQPLVPIRKADGRIFLHPVRKSIHRGRFGVACKLACGAVG